MNFYDHLKTAPTYHSQLEALMRLPGINQEKLLNDALQQQEAAAKQEAAINRASALSLQAAKTFEDYEKQETMKYYFSDAHLQPKTLEALNRVDEVEEMKKKFPLAKEVAKMTNPFKQIIKPVLDPDPTIDHMLVRQAREKMLAARKDWSTDEMNRPCVLNINVTRLDAWNIIWSSLVPMSGDGPLAPWMIKRVHQVCDNVMDPSISAVTVDSVLNPKPHLVKKAPPPEPPNPFDREFS